MTDLTASDNTPPCADKMCDKVDLQQSILFYSVWTLYLSLPYNITGFIVYSFFFYFQTSPLTQGEYFG